MKRKSRIVLILHVVFLSLSLTACVSDGPEQKDNTTPPSLNGIADDYDWTTTQKTQLTVNVDDQYNGQFNYTVEVFLGNPATDANAQFISGGKTNKKMPYTAEIVLPDITKNIYILQTDPYQRKRVYSFEVEKIKMECNLGQAAKRTSRAAFIDNSNFTFPSVDFAVPANAKSIQNNEKIKTGTSYVVESGNTLSVKDLPGEGNFSLFIKGTIIIEDNCTLQNRGKIFILDGGKLTSKNNKTLYCVENSQIAVDLHGVLGDEDNKLQLSLTDYSILINKGDAELDEIYATSGAQIYNNGEFDVKFLSTTDITTKIVNTKDFDVSNSLILTNGIIYNTCKFECKNLETNGGTINLASGILECEKIKAGGLKLNMDALSMLECDNIHFNSQMNYVTGSTEDFALILAKNIVIEGGGLAVRYSGKVEIKAELHTENGQWQNKYELIAPACFAKGEPSAQIPKDECNDNKGNVNPGDTENPDTDPDYEEEHTLAYMHIFEDNWPSFGDYDMNDLVMSLQISNKKKGNQTVGFKYKAIVYAAGAAKPYGAAFQLDGISAGNINGSESGQTYAVIRLFDEVHDLFGVGKNQIVNTYIKTKEPVVIEGDITFNTPINGVINIENVNPFIVWGGMENENRNEIHMPYYKGTDKAATSLTSVDYKYKAVYKNGELKQGNPEYNNLMWVLRIPEPTFAFPKEGVKIMDAYPNFKEWVSSGGKNEEMAGWYMNPNTNLTISIK